MKFKNSIILSVFVCSMVSVLGAMTPKRLRGLPVNIIRPLKQQAQQSAEIFKQNRQKIENAIARQRKNMPWTLNTGNKNKQAEFKRLFAALGVNNLQFTSKDLDEIQADPVSVVVNKASQLPNRVIVEDTSLDIESADIGVNIKWNLANLDKLIGKKAVFRTLLAYKDGNKVYVYKGEVPGTIVEKAGEKGFGFDPYFKPNASDKTLAQLEEIGKKDDFSPRKKAIENFMSNNPVKNPKTGKYFFEPITEWEGEWQEDK